MKQVNLKLKSYAGNVRIINDGNLYRRILNSLLLALALLSFLYIAFLGNMIKNIVERKTFENSARALHNEVSELELTYLSESQKIDLELSKTLGFRESVAKYVTRQSIGILKLGKNEI